MRNIDLDSLQIFKAVVEQGGITKAAAQLNRVQSNITTRVKNLEDRLGVKLFQRQSGKLILSAEGKLLLTYADRLLRLSAEAEAAIRSGKPRGTLRIGTMESTAAARLPSVLARYHTAYPDVQIELVTGTSGALISKVLNYEVEAAFVAEPFTKTGLERQQAFVEELVLITAKNTPPVKTPADLQKHTIIAFSTGCSYRRILEDWLSDSAVVPDRVLELGSYHAIVACVAAGSGLAIVPRSVLRAVNAEHDVIASPLPQRIAQANTWLVWRAGHQSVALDAMQRELLEVNGKQQTGRKRAA
jgi:DNA-binding transcriptional LysR family regulator